MEEKIVRNLKYLIRNAAINYRNGFSWNDVKLTDEFKNVYSKYLSEVKSSHSIDFNEYTAVLTTSSNLQIFIPNQWFALAVYAKEVCRELLKYKAYFEKVVQNSFDCSHDTALILRGASDKQIVQKFSMSLREILEDEYNQIEDKNMINEAIDYVTKFVTDYNWWSGSKTIDRGDFYVSVILNMLNLVNASQGYVADITYAYCTYDELDSVTNEIASFTVDLGDSTWQDYDDSINYSFDDIEYPNNSLLDTIAETPRQNIIHISGKTKKEIKIKT